VGAGEVAIDLHAVAEVSAAYRRALAEQPPSSEP
jgi:hypothetical protein